MVRNNGIGASGTGEGARVLFSCNPAFGHFHPQLPLARELRGRGCEVAFVTSAALADAVSAEGFDLLPAGPGLDVVYAEMFRRHPALAEVPLKRQFFEFAPRFFSELRVELTAAEALSVVSGWRPDAVIIEPCDFVGPLVAAELGIPHATVSFGPALDPLLLRRMCEAVAPAYSARGLTPPEGEDLFGSLYFDICPPSLQIPEFRPPANRHPLRPEPYRQTGVRGQLPNFGARAERPLVLLTMGTTFGAQSIMSEALAGLSGLDVNVLVVVGPYGDPDQIEADPRRVRVERFVPLDVVLDRCSLVVTHGGAGSTLAGLARGVPLVVIPQGADQFINAERAVATGAALSIDPEGFGADALRLAAERVIYAPCFAAAARRIRDEVEAMPGTEAAALLLAEHLLVPSRGTGF